jgi:hypothetical protein
MIRGSLDGGVNMDGITQCQTEIRRLRGILRENEEGYAEVLQALGREYDRAREQEQCAGSYRELLDQDIKALHMEAYGYDYDHALDNRESA